jgi:hypothetical protein
MGGVNSMLALSYNAYSRIGAGALRPGGLPECTIELAGPRAHYFFGCGWTAGSLVGGTMFFNRM